jgi:hypothetical protein
MGAQGPASALRSGAASAGRSRAVTLQVSARAVKPKAGASQQYQVTSTPPTLHVLCVFR